MEVMMKHIDPQLPRNTDEIVAGGEHFTFKDFFMADRHLADFMFGTEGIHSIFNCVRCWTRFGPHVKTPHLRDATPTTRTWAKMQQLGAVAKSFEAYNDDVQKFKEEAQRHPLIQAQLRVMRDLNAAGKTYVHTSTPTNMKELIKVLYSQKYVPLTATPVERYITEACHFCINIVRAYVSGPKKQPGLFEVMGREIGFDVQAKLCERFGKDRPIQGWDANVCVCIIRNYEFWATEIIQRHRLGNHVRTLLEQFRLIIKYFMEAELDDPEVDILQTAVTSVNDVLETFFSPRQPLPGWLNHGGALGGAVRPQHYHFGLTHHYGWYEHDLACHTVALAREHGSIIRFSSWVVEAMNRVWKRVLEQHCNRRDGRLEGGASSEDVAKQVLRRVCRILNPTTRGASSRDIRIAGVYTCGKCGEEKIPGHTNVCPFGP